MFIELCQSKIAYAKITQTELFYEGSITIDENLLKAANILPGQKVEVLNVNNGNRFTTYAITGPSDSGQIGLNGPAARLGVVGDQIMILSYALMEPKEAKNHKIKVVALNESNRIKN